MIIQIPCKAVLAALLVIFLGAGCKKKAEAPKGGGGPVPVNVGEAVSKDMPIELRAIGNVEAIATVDVKAQVPGELIAVNFEEGQDVKKGDLLFTIQPKLYATQLAQAEANLARDRAQAESAERDHARQVELDKKGAGTKETLDQTRAQADAARAVVAGDEALVEIAKVRLGYTTIESPIDGRTGSIAVRAGNLIKENADTSMTTIKQIAPIYVTFSVPEQHLADVRRGLAERMLRVVATEPRTKRLLGEGTLTFVANAVDMTTGTVQLKATFPNADRALWPGTFVAVRLELDVTRGAIVIPSSAIMNGQKGSQIYVIKPDTSAELRLVTIERALGDEVVITDGVAAGEKVVTNGQLRLVPGAKALIKPSAGESAAPPTPTEKSTKEEPAKKDAGASAAEIPWRGLPSGGSRERSLV